MIHARRPASVQELTSMLVSAAQANQQIELVGAGSKQRLGGAHRKADVSICLADLNRVLEYEPNDLTISVEAGMKWADLQSVLAAHNQMVPLDPPWFDSATVGGVIATNSCGPRRRLYGSARDAVIGMKFVTLQGAVVQSGGMVVKNVAGLDMGKLMIGSFGTLAAIASVNFKLTPIPPVSRTFALSFEALDAVMKQRDQILQGVLQPAALDLLNPQAAANLGLEGWTLLLEAVGSQRVIDRYARELSGARTIDGTIWRSVREYVPEFLHQHPQGAVVRFSTPLQGLAAAAADVPVPLVARAGNGVVYTCFPDCQSAHAWLKLAVSRGVKGVVEAVPPQSCRGEEQWPHPQNDLVVMEKIKHMLDPGNLLNAGRLYGRL
ncbi:MAG: FAD-binding oxidoreductase [Bryobacterales bacterium]|nr:FAD-binding oxidoreductase [Bryobacterales bacterium]